MPWKTDVKMGANTGKKRRMANVAVTYEEPEIGFKCEWTRVAVDLASPEDMNKFKASMEAKMQAERTDYVELHNAEKMLDELLNSGGGTVSA